MKRVLSLVGALAILLLGADLASAANNVAFIPARVRPVLFPRRANAFIPVRTAPVFVPRRAFIPVPVRTFAPVPYAPVYTPYVPAQAQFFFPAQAPVYVPRGCGY